MALTNSQSQILDAVAAVVVRDGIAGVNMRAVATEAGVSLGLLGYHFDDKKTMVGAAFQMMADQLIDHRFRAVSRTNGPQGRLVAFLRSPFDDDLLGGTCPSMMLTLWSSAQSDEQLGATERTLKEHDLADLTALTGQLRPELERTELDALVQALRAFEKGLIVEWTMSSDRQNLDIGIAHCLKMAVTS